MDEYEAALLEQEDDEPEGLAHINQIQQLAKEDSGESEVEDGPAKLVAVSCDGHMTYFLGTRACLILI